MIIDLRTLPCVLLTIAEHTERHARIREWTCRHGISNIKCIVGRKTANHHIGAKEMAIEALNQIPIPCLWIEDDAMPTPHFQSVAEIPDNTQIFYIGGTRYGWQKVLRPRFPRALNTIQGIRSETPGMYRNTNDPRIIRILSMWGAHGIIWLCDATRKIIVSKMMASPPQMTYDSVLARSLWEFETYGLRHPYVYQCDGKNDEDSYSYCTSDSPFSINGTPPPIIAVVSNYGFSENANHLKQNLSKFFPTFLIDSESPDTPSCVDITIPNTHYPGQWNAAVRLAKDMRAEWLLFVASDLDIPDFASLAQYANEATSNSKIGVWTPSLSHDSRLSYKFCHHMPTNGLREAFIAEGFFFLARTSILTQLHPIPKWNKYGWTVDRMTAYKAYESGFTVAVDDRLAIHHPASIHPIDQQMAITESQRYVSPACQKFTRWAQGRIRDYGRREKIL